MKRIGTAAVRRRRVSFVMVTMLSILAAMPSGVAQTGRGTIGGRVTDISGAVLRAARVEVQPGGQTTFTDDQGQYFLTDVAAGDSRITITYVGFATVTTNVKVAAGQAVRADAVMKVATATEEVLVTADRARGEAEAINRTLESDNILQVLPVEVITSLPNTNIADALGRMPSVTLERDEGEGKYVQIRGLEPRLANVTIDGVNTPSPESGVRQIKLDVIPANLVDSVEINKTLSANQDGDAVAGSVNLVTKTQGEKPTLYLNGIGGYTPIVGGRSLYEIDGTVGKRFGSSKRLGVIFGGSYDWNGRGIDDVEPSPTAIQCDPGPTGCVNPSSSAPFFSTYGTQDWREYRYYRTRYGFTGAVDYKLGDVSGLYVRFLYSHFDNFGDRWVYTPSTNSGTDSMGNPTSGWLTPNLTDGNASMSFGSQIRRPVEVIGSLVAGGKHAFTRWVFAYDFSVARSASEDHGYASSNFQNPNTYQFNIVTANPNTPKFVPTAGSGSVFDTTQYFLNNGDVSKTYSPQLNLQAGFSAQRNYNWAGHFGVFDFGFKFRNAHKFQDSVDNYFMLDPATDSSGNPLINPNDPSLAMTNFLDSFTNSNYYDKAYTFGRTTNYSKIQSFLNANLSAAAGATSFFVPDVNSTAQNTFPNNFNLVERVTAGYLMNTIDIGRIVRVQTGIRFEGTTENVLGYNVLFDANGGLCTAPDPIDPGCPNPFSSAINPVRRNSDYIDVLPSMQLRFRVGNDGAIRASYGRGISRPNFGDLPPFFNAQGNKANEIDIGNPNLTPSRANNYDLLYEQNLKPLGLVQAGFFFKQLSHPIYESAKEALTADVAKQYNIPSFYVSVPPSFDLSRPVNGQSATVYGFEIAYLQHWTFLPGALGGIGLAANYGYTHSKTNGGTFVPGGTPPALLRTDNPALLRQAPNTWNISPTYDRWRISARLGISHNDANIFSYNYQNLNSDGTPATVGLGLKGPNGDTYLYAHTQVDAQASIRMYRGLHFIVAGLNLTNEVFGFYNGSTQYPIQREYYKPSYMFGLRYTLSNEPR